jgi:hypothetical protein
VVSLDGDVVAVSLAGAAELKLLAVLLGDATAGC